MIVASLFASKHSVILPPSSATTFTSTLFAADVGEAAHAHETDSHAPGAIGLCVAPPQIVVEPSWHATETPAATMSAPRLHTSVISVAFAVPVHEKPVAWCTVRSGTADGFCLPGTFCRKLLRPVSSQLGFHSEVFVTVPVSETWVIA